MVKRKADDALNAHSEEDSWSIMMTFPKISVFLPLL